MPNLNQVTLMGNLCRDVEVKHLPNGTAIADVGLAINRNWKDQNGNKKEEVTFVDITLFGRTAEVAGEYLRKGSPALFCGRLKLDQWDDKTTGAKRSKLKVIADTLQLLGSKGEGGGGSQQRQSSRPNSEPAGESGVDSFYDDAGSAGDGSNVPF